MKILLLPLVALMLIGSGCTPIDEVNDERIAQYKKCADAGMSAYYRAGDGAITCDIPSKD